MKRPEIPRVDEQLCTACGGCVSVCPDRILRLNEHTVVVDGDSCLLCGHCAAVCPVEAIAITGLTVRLGLVSMAEKADCIEPGPGCAAELVSLMRHRRSCRVFKADPVDLDLLRDLVRIGTTAPSGTNSQKWQFIILPKRGDVERLGDRTAEFFRRLNNRAANPVLRLLSRFFLQDRLGIYYRNYYATVAEGLRGWEENGEDRLFHGAPSAIVVASDDSASCPGEDCLLATQNILLAAQAMGLGTCLIGFVVEAARRDRRLRDELRLGPREQVYSVIAIGYPAVRYLRPAGRLALEPRIISSDEGK